MARSFADATPQELSTALMSAGSWGLVHEPAASGPLNADVLAGTNNVILNTNMFHAVTLQPENIQVCPCSHGPRHAQLAVSHLLLDGQTTFTCFVTLKSP